ncbi:hypothetical protein TNCT_292221 [Trichonephila clavata]|uniref:Uncharacterized protein n=1 Tax=Trichonephila clavata TaxID=2740835 RepID=A0A8X6FZ53_TRICU|nr:hypothetical protein TNCT_292221 [Trichonephila clavata]
MKVTVPYIRHSTPTRRRVTHTYKIQHTLPLYEHTVHAHGNTPHSGHARREPAYNKHATTRNTAPVTPPRHRPTPPSQTQHTRKRHAPRRRLHATMPRCRCHNTRGVVAPLPPYTPRPHAYTMPPHATPPQRHAQRAYTRQIRVAAQRRSRAASVAHSHTPTPLYRMLTLQRYATPAYTKNAKHRRHRCTAPPCHAPTCHAIQTAARIWHRYTRATCMSYTSYIYTVHSDIEGTRRTSTRHSIRCAPRRYAHAANAKYIRGTCRVTHTYVVRIARRQTQRHATPAFANSVVNITYRHKRHNAIRANAATPTDTSPAHASPPPSTAYTVQRRIRYADRHRTCVAHCRRHERLSSSLQRPI